MEKWSPIQHRKNNNKELITKLEMSYTLVVTAMFMDVFWDPLLGFDESKLKAKLIGDGTGKVSCIALKDVGEFVAAMVTAPDTTATENKTIRIGGDHILSGDPIKTFEKVTGKQVEVARVPLETTDPALAFPRLLATSFYDLEGWENGMFPDVKPWTLEQFAREKFGK